MALIEWDKSFAIGIPSVDYEHRQLIVLINELHGRLSADAANEEIIDFLGEIDTRIGAHFALEERTMRDMKYDQYADHKADHERLLDDIRNIMDSFEAGTYRDCSDILAEHLNDWFTHHFRTKDARLHRVLVSQDR
jgi:hemerythrin